MKSKVTAAVLCAALTATMFSACGTSSSSSSSSEAASSSSDASSSIVTEKTDLTYIYPDGDEGAKAINTSLVKKFNEENPDITVTIQPGNGGSYSEFLKTKQGVGEFPDVLVTTDTQSYIDGGYLAPLPDDIVALMKDVKKVDGKVYTVSLSGDMPCGIFYNKDYFDQNNLTEPTTYDDFITLCKTIKDKGDMSPLVVGGSDLWHMGFLFTKCYNDNIYAADQDFIKDCYSGTKDFNDDTFKNTFKEMKDLIGFAQDGWTSTSDSQITTFLISKKSAMFYSGSHMVSQIKEADPSFNFGWFAIPSPDGKMRVLGASSLNGLAISAESAKDANKLAAGEAFIKFMFRKDNYKEYCEQVGCSPMTADAPEISVDGVLGEIIENAESADEITNFWNNQIGDNQLPPDFRNFVYKTLVEYLQGTKDLDTSCSAINDTFATDSKDFNPVKGIGNK